LERKNRFVATVLLDGKEEVVHVKNTGRCRELLVPGAKVYLTEPDSLARKTRFDLVAVEKERSGKKPILINMDSFAPNLVAAEWIRAGNLFSSEADVMQERTFHSSRFDLYAEEGDRKAFLEVKGVTLEKDGHCAFPDAPTERGKKHLRELMNAVEEGFEAYVIFVIQMSSVTSFSPNDKTDPEFGSLLRLAVKKGVIPIAIDCLVTPGKVLAGERVPILLETKKVFL
jgi:sugar fermentation stimulation protein A